MKVRFYLGMNAYQMEELREHLYRNGYDVEWVSDGIIDVYEDEVDYFITILKDRNVEYLIGETRR